MTKQQTTPKRLMRLPEVKRITGLSKSSIYDRMNEGIFPKSVPLGGRTVGWVESEVDEWVETRIASRGGI
jgi:prophage regulatory protein